MSAAHWLVPPRTAPMGSRPLPGVPAHGHALDPRGCSACGTAALDARPRRAPEPRPARIVPSAARVVAPAPTPAPAAAPRVTFYDSVTPSDEVVTSVRELGTRLGWAGAARELQVGETSLQRISDRQGVRRETMRRVLRGLDRVRHRVPADPAAAVPAAMRDATRDACAHHGRAAFARLAGVAPEVVDRVIAGFSVRASSAERLRLALAHVPTSPSTLSGRDMVLLAVADLALGRGALDAVVAEADLVVRAWSLYPEAFSLRGHAHPDSNRVRTRLYGATGVIACGWLRRVSAGGEALTVALTPAGIAHITARMEAP